MFKKTKSFYKLIFLIIILLLAYFSDSLINKTNTTHNREIIDQTINISNSNFQAYFVDVGQADCILIKSNNEYALVDAGNNLDETKLVNYFKNLGIKKFKYVFGTHAHEDHIGGIDAIINNFDVEHLYMPETKTNLRTYTDIIAALNNKNMTYEVPSIDTDLYLNKTLFKILYIGNDPDNINENSIVIKVIYQNISLLLTSDAPAETEYKIMEKDIKSDILKVSHHGSKDANSAKFLKKVNPKYSIIQVGKGNEYGFPKEVILNKLKYLKSTIYRTDEVGTIIASSDGNNIDINTIKTDTNQEDTEYEK